ncbi:MAG: FAD-binding oxidoreductase [Clostridia bacterium]|nr:FAD-binding oxidoreductase [Clostridia bacterium]
MDLIRKLVSADEEYLRDESKKVGFAETISFPENHEQVREIMAQLYKDGTSVTVQGSRTGLASAAVPFGGHILNTSRMDKVLGMREKDGHFYITVQPGVILQKLNKAIAARAFDTSAWDEASQAAFEAFGKAPVQMFTPDPTESTAAIGGMVACNASGAKSYHYGATRGHIQALRGVLANGESICIKRGEIFAKGLDLALTTEEGNTINVKLPTYKMPNCKNASGYYCAPDMDAIDLMIGSDGTLAVLTEIEISLLPVPALSWGVSTFFEAESQAAKYTKLAKQIANGIVAIEYFDACALDILRKQKAENTAFAGLPFLPESYGCAVYTELHCDNEDQAYELLESLSKYCTQAGGNPEMTWVATSDSDRDMLHFFRHAVPESVNMQVERTKRTYPEVTKVGGDLAVPDEYFEELLKIYDTTLEEEGLLHAAWGHIGDNHIHVNILPRDMDEYSRGKALLAKWAGEVSRMGGAVSAEHGVGKLKAPFLEVMYGKEHISEMAALKAVFDPKCMLGRGNLFAPQEEVKA